MVVTIATLNQDVFSVIRALLIANKPSYAYNGTTFTYTIVAEYPKDTAQFPCIVVNEADSDSSILGNDDFAASHSIDVNPTLEPEIEVVLEFYAKEAHGKKAIAAGRDSVRNTIRINIASLFSSGLIPNEKGFLEDSGNGTFQDGNQIINSAALTLRLKLK